MFDLAAVKLVLWRERREALSAQLTALPSEATRVQRLALARALDAIDRLIAGAMDRGVDDDEAARRRHLTAA